jgi:hypothetical protein
MASIQHAYRRGARLLVAPEHSIGAGSCVALYISLRTHRPAEARRRAHALTVVSDKIKTHILDVIEAILSSAGRKRTFQTALQRQLHRIITDQVDMPEEAETHRRLNAFSAALYRIWAARGTAAGPETADLDRLRADVPFGDDWTKEILGESAAATPPTARTPPEAPMSGAVQSPPEQAAETSPAPACSTLWRC